MSRISPGTMTLGIFAVLFALAGAYAFRSYMQKETPPAPQAEEPTLFPLAATDLKAGKTLALGDIALVPLRRQDFQQRNIPATTAMADARQIVGRILKVDIKQGEPFLTTSLYPEGEGPPLPVKPGYRAVTIPITNVEAVAGFAVPGTYVDVLFRTRPRTGDRASLPIPEATVPLIEGVEVLALGTTRSPGSAAQGNVNTVTLAVTPEQAKTLQVVVGRGDLSLALRSPGESLLAGQYRRQALTLEDLLGIEPPPPPFFTEIYRRTSRQVLGFVRDQVVSDTQAGLPAVAPVVPAAGAAAENQPAIGVPGAAAGGPRPAGASEEQRGSQPTNNG